MELATISFIHAHFLKSEVFEAYLCSIKRNSIIFALISLAIFFVRRPLIQILDFSCIGWKQVSANANIFVSTQSVFFTDCDCTCTNMG